MYALETKTKFRKDVKRVSRRGWDLNLLTEAADHLIAAGTLPDSYGAHPLGGDYKGCIDAHLKPDWVLIYEVDEEERVIVLHRTGSHQDLFKKALD